MRTYPIIAAIIIALTTSCQRNELYYDTVKQSSSVEIYFQWDTLQNNLPEGMYIFLYSNAATQPILEFTPTYGGVIDIPYGSYSMLAVGNNSQKILFRGEESYNTSEAYTKGDGTIMSEPDYLEVASMNNFETTPSIPYITINPTPINYITSVAFNFHGIEGVEHLSRVRIMVSGLARSIMLSSGKLSFETGVISPEYTFTSDGFRGTFNTFGYYGTNSVEHLLTVQFYYGGEIITKRYDVTEMLDATGHIEITDKLIFYPVIDGDGGFDMGVGDWEREDIIIPI